MITYTAIAIKGISIPIWKYQNPKFRIAPARKYAKNNKGTIINFAIETGLLHFPLPFVPLATTL